MDATDDDARTLLDELAALEDGPPWRVHLELLHHLVVTGADDPDTGDARLVRVPVRFGTPGSARLVAHVVARAEADRRSDLARRCLVEVAEAPDRARAATLVAVAPHLASPEPAAIVAMGMTSASARIAGLLALGRDLDAQREASGELRARVVALVFSTAPPSPPWASEQAWWRALAIGVQAQDGLSDADRAEAVTALVGIEDGAWHLLLLRAHPPLASAMAWADRTGEAFLAAVARQGTAADVERLREILAAMDGEARARTASRVVDLLAPAPDPGAAPPASPPDAPGASMPDSTAGSTGEDSSITIDHPPLSTGTPPGEPFPTAERGRGTGRKRRLTRSLPPLSRRRAGGPPDPATGLPDASPEGPEASPPGPDASSEGPDPVVGARPSPADRAGIVSTGFAGRDAPHETVDPASGLLPDTDYRFWLEVAPNATADSIELEPVALPADLPARARLTVALFAYDGELRLRPNATYGLLQLAEGGTASVVAQPGGEPVSPGERRLRFPVTTPATGGPARLRCSIYHHGVLVQSRVVTAEIVTRGHEALAEQRPLVSVVDYRLFRTLDAAPLSSLSQHRASLLLNDDGAGTHGLRFVAMDGDDVITRDVSIGEGAIGDQIGMARRALRRISWGNAEEWAEGRVYRYGSHVDERTLTADLVSLASNGARFFQLLVEEVAAADPGAVGPPDPYLARDRIAEVLRRPGRIQIALQQGPHHILPAALIYDHWLTDSAPIEDYRLCPGYLAAVRDGVPLEQAPCFRGDCPQALVGAELTVVCPSGFWGFRHELGFPVTQSNDADATEVIAVHGSPAVSVGVSTELTSAATHVQALRALNAGEDGWRIARTRQDFLAGLASDDRQVVYLYCHGGVSDNVPYVRLGEVGARPITRLDLANARVRWSTTRPLVFLNGCHTTALDPETAIDFVRFFVGAALASGVIGTEITIFEELGEIFGERFMQRFLVPGSTVGAAIRGARLDLLAAGNPLGLVYIPFALAGLKLGTAEPGG